MQDIKLGASEPNTQERVVIGYKMLYYVIVWDYAASEHCRRRYGGRGDHVLWPMSYGFT